MKIISKRSSGVEHTWDFSTDTETYLLSNGCISHNTSSKISNATNGIEPPRSKVSVKANKDEVMKQVVPNIRLAYDYLWEQKTPIGYLNTMAIVQKFTDQAMSNNLSYNSELCEDEKLSMTQLMKDILYAYKTGAKTIYYMNQKVTTAPSDEPEEEDVLPEMEEDECETCKL